MNTSHADVIIVGAGPTGLLLAGELASAGLSVTIVEKRCDESNLTRAFVVHARTMELFDCRGIADKVESLGVVQPGFQLIGDNILELNKLDSPFPYALITPQYNVEDVLRERALAAGVTIESGMEVTALHQNPEEVELTLLSRGITHKKSASYVVGTDGVHSTVRRLLGMPFPGRRAIGSVMLGDVQFATQPKQQLRLNANKSGFALMAPFGALRSGSGDSQPDSQGATEQYWRVICRGADEKLTEVDLDRMREILRQVFGSDFGMHSPRWMAQFDSDERQVRRYRIGRVFLAGDAAHSHSPAGGQGMNLGLGDAVNLGWKLAAVAQGWAPDTLLDSYQAERHPVGKQVLLATAIMLRIGLSRSAAVEFARKRIAGRLLARPAVTRRLAGVISGVATRYRAPKNADRAVGDRCKDIELTGRGDQPTRLFEALRSGSFVFVTTQQNPSLPPELRDRVAVVEPRDTSLPPTLVRPDGYIAWRGDVGETARWGYWVKS